MRQSAQRQREPDILDVGELTGLLDTLPDPYRTMVFVAAATLLKSRGADVKVVQDSLRHANARITMEMYAQALSQDKRTAQTKV